MSGISGIVNDSKSPCREITSGSNRYSLDRLEADKNTLQFLLRLKNVSALARNVKLPVNALRLALFDVGFQDGSKKEFWWKMSETMQLFYTRRQTS